jgi:hypothetical protein
MESPTELDSHSLVNLIGLTETDLTSYSIARDLAASILNPGNPSETINIVNPS